MKSKGTNVEIPISNSQKRAKLTMNPPLSIRARRFLNVACQYLGQRSRIYHCFIFTRMVRSSLYDNLALPATILKHLFMGRTSLSNRPPHQGARTILKVHSTLLPGRCLFTSGCVIIRLIVLAAHLNVLPLSDTILHCSPLL